MHLVFYGISVRSVNAKVLDTIMVLVIINVLAPAGGIIIIANLLPNMLGAGMHGNVRGASCWCIGGVLGLVRGVPH